LEKIQAASAAAKSSESGVEAETAADPAEKPIEAMSDEELAEAETAARRRLLDAQHAELREREIARVAGAEEATGRPPGLREFLGGLQKHKRRTWR
jgi:hypothetical protein